MVYAAVEADKGQVGQFFSKIGLIRLTTKIRFSKLVLNQLFALRGEQFGLGIGAFGN